MDAQQKETAQSQLKQAMLAQCGPLISLFNDNAKKACVAAMAVVAMTGAPTQDAVAGPLTGRVVVANLSGNLNGNNAFSTPERRQLDKMVRESKSERDTYLKSARNVAFYERQLETAQTPEAIRRVQLQIAMSKRDAVNSITRMDHQADRIDQVLNVAKKAYGQDVSGYHSDMATIRSTPRQDVRSINTYSEIRAERAERNHSNNHHQPDTHSERSPSF